jgi:hypothetical protein
MIYSIKGTIVNNQSQDPIKGAKILILPENFIFTDNEGKFTITGDIPESGSLSMIITSPNYQSLEPSLYKGDNTLKTDLGVLQLQPIVSSLTQDKIKSTQLSKNQIKEISKGKKDFSYYAEEKLANQVNTIKNTLIPSILTMVATFGITKISNYSAEQLPKLLDQSFCPTQDELNNLINRKNKLVKQLNNSLKIIDVTTISLGVVGGIITLLRVPLLAAETTPPFSNPIPSGVEKRLDRTISILQATNTGILSILIILRQVLIQAIQILNLLDQLIFNCYPEADQERLSIELTALTQQQSQQLSPLVTNVNGFDMEIETESTTSTLKRRRAIARNKQGVVMLRGEWSFSSIDQILIDELVFYIQQNDLKPD